MRWNLQDIGGGECMVGRDTKLERAYYVCPEAQGDDFSPWIGNFNCELITGVQGQRGWPCGKGCKLNHLICSEAYQDAVGGSMSGRQLASSDGSWGQGVEERRKMKRSGLRGGKAGACVSKL